MKRLKLLFFTILSFFTVQSYSQLTVDNTTLTPEQLVQQILVGQGVTVSNITFNGSAADAQTLQIQAGTFDGTNSNIGINQGMMLGTGDINVAPGPNNSGSASMGSPADYQDPDLNQVSSVTLNDAAVLEFDFVPQGDSVKFNYVFSSEEYNEYVCSNFNDIFAFFLSGPGINGPFTNNAENIAIIPGSGGTPVAINTLNSGAPGTFGSASTCDQIDPNWSTYNTFFVNNEALGQNTVQYDGFTVPLEAVAEVQCGQTYHIKLAIADAFDGAFDSGVFFQSNSFSSQGVDVSVQTVTGDTTIVEGCGGASFIFSRPPDNVADSLIVDFDISGTAINGTDYNFVADSVIFVPGEDTIIININPVADGITEGPESITFTTYIINQCGDTIESEGTLWIVDQLPVILSVNDTVLNCPEDSIPITFEVTQGVPSYNPVWGGGQTTDTIWVPGDQSGTYTIDVTDNCGQVGSESIDVTFNPPTPLNIIFNSNTFNLCPGESATATVVNVQNAQGPITYDWSTGAITQSITAQMPSGTTEHFIPVTVSDGCLEATDSVKLTLSEVDITDITVSDATDCPPNIAVPDGSIDVTTNPATGMTFDLSGGGNSYNNTTGSFANLSGGINYFLTVTDANGCFKDTIVYVDVATNATAFDGPNNIIDIDCFGAQNGEAEITNITGGPTGVPYTVIWENADGTTITETVNSVGGSDAQDTLHGGQWTITVLDDGGCAASEVFDIEEPDELIVDLTANSLISCHNMSDGSIDMTPSGGTGNPGSYDIQWSNGATTEDIDQIPAGTYEVIVTDDNGCKDTNTLTLNNPPQLDIDVITTDAICYGTYTGGVQLNVNEAQGSPNDWNFIYNPGGVNTNNSFLNHLNANTYTVQFFDSVGCDTILTFPINEPTPINYNIVTDPALCRASEIFPGSGSVSATNVTGGAGGYSYVWTDGTDSTNTPTWGARPGGEYYLTITDGNGCSVQDTVFLDSLNPEANFTLDPNWGVAPVFVDVENTSQNVTQNASYSWNVNGWVISVQDSTYAPDTTFTNPGSYEICLTVTNVYQCKDSICAEVRVVPPLTITPANIFTPNGDGVNDVFHFSINGATIFTCTIFNRWGQEVYSWEDPNAGWDGVHQNGSEMPEGVYFYKYEVAGEDGNVKTGEGSFHLVRNNN